MSDAANSGLCVVGLYGEPDTYFVNGERVGKDTYEAVRKIETALNWCANRASRRGRRLALVELDDPTLEKRTETYIWLSAFAANNRKSAYHGLAHECWAEAERRDKPEIYKRAYNRAVATS